MDGLGSMRLLWISFFLFVPAAGVVATVVVSGEPETSTFIWTLVLTAAPVSLLAGQALVLSRPLDCSDPATLAASYRTRFFVAMALAEAIALLAFVATIATARWWVFWLAYPFAAYGQWRDAPTAAHLESDQEQLKLSGCSLSLVGALRGQGRADT